MKLSSSVPAVAAAVGFFLQFAEAKSMASSLFDWHYELNAAAPAITTRDELSTMAAAYNQTVSIELVDGTIMLVEQMEKKQVATFGGALKEWAWSNYPSDLEIANMKKSGEMAGHQAELNDLLAGVAAGKSMSDMLAARRVSQRDLTKRNPCACPILVFSCLLISGCEGVCFVAACLG